MTSSQLKYLYETAKPDGYFFTRNNMKFAGDTMRNYGVNTFEHEGETYHELYRRKPVKHGLSSSTWFKASDMSHSSRNPVTGEL